MKDIIKGKDLKIESCSCIKNNNVTEHSNEKELEKNESAFKNTSSLRNLWLEV